MLGIPVPAASSVPGGLGVSGGDLLNPSAALVLSMGGAAAARLAVMPVSTLLCMGPGCLAAMLPAAGVVAVGMAGGGAGAAGGGPGPRGLLQLWDEILQESCSFLMAGRHSSCSAGAAADPPVGAVQHAEGVTHAIKGRIRTGGDGLTQARFLLDGHLQRRKAVTRRPAAGDGSAAWA